MENEKYSFLDKRITNLEGNFNTVIGSTQKIATLELSYKIVKEDVTELKDDMGKIVELIKEESKIRKGDYKELSDLIGKESKARILDIDNRKKELNNFKYSLLVAVVSLLIGMCGTAFYGSTKMHEWIEERIKPVQVEVNKNEKEILDIYKRK